MGINRPEVKRQGMQNKQNELQFAFAWHCVYDKPHHGGQHKLFLGFLRLLRVLLRSVGSDIVESSPPWLATHHLAEANIQALDFTATRNTAKGSHRINNGALQEGTTMSSDLAWAPKLFRQNSPVLAPCSHCGSSSTDRGKRGGGYGPGMTI